MVDLTPSINGTFIIFECDSESNSQEDLRICKILCRKNVKYEIVRDEVRIKDIITSSDVCAVIILPFGNRSLCAEILDYTRKARSKLPIMVCDDYHSEDHRVCILELGADIYTSFDSSDRELRAYIRNLVRHSRDFSKVMEIDDLLLWRNERIAIRRGRPIKLSTKEMDILCLLADNRNRIVSRASILKSVFGLDFDPGTNLVEVHIHHIREKIDRGFGRQLLSTVRGAGYVLGDPLLPLLSCLPYAGVL